MVRLWSLWLIAMDSWTLQGDSYSFLRSAPRTFSLRHRDGTPNHVEIFDITNIPSHRSAISETTCLCDIFGDDCESPSLSNSPASGSLVHHQREVDGTATASTLVDDLNDSSGSYHTATGSSEGEEAFEDSRENLQSPKLQRENSGRRQSESQGLSSGHPGLSRDISPRVELSSTPPIPQLRTGSSLPEALKPTCINRTPSPGYASPHTLNPEGRISSLSSSFVDTVSSLSSPDLRHTSSLAELRSISPRSGDRHSYASHLSSTPTPSPEPKSRANSPSSESVNTHSLPESREVQLSPELRNASHNHTSTPSPEPRSKSYSPDLTSPTFNPRVIVSSYSPSVSSTAISSQSREVSASPELKNRSCSPDTQASSPFPELRGRVSLPDLLSRGSTPDIEESPCIPELIPQPASPGRDTTTPENQDSRSSAEPCSAVSTPAPKYTPPPPVTSLAPTPELRQDSVSPEQRGATPSPGSLSSASPTKTWTRTPSPARSPEITYTSPPHEIRRQASSPAVSYNSAPSPEIRSNYSPVEPRHTAASPEIRITASSPEVRRREPSPEVNLTFNSLDLHLNSTSPNHRSLASSPHITGICYSIIQPEDRETTVSPERSQLSSPEPSRTHLSPEQRSPSSSRDSRRSSVAESTDSPGGSPHMTGFTCTVIQSENSDTTPSPRPRYQTPSPERKHQTPSPEVNRRTPSPEPLYQTPSSERYQTPSPTPRSRDLSPVASSPEPRCNPCSPVAPSPVVHPQYTHPSPQLRNTPEVEVIPSDITGIQYSTHSIEDRVSASFELNTAAKSPVIDIRDNSTVVKSPVRSPQPRTSPFSAEEKGLDSSLEQNSIDRVITSKEINHQYSPSLASLFERNQEKEVPNHYSPCELQTPSPNPPASLGGRSPNKSPSHKAASISPVQRVGDPHSKYPAYSLTPDHRESHIYLKSIHTPERSGKEPSPKASSGARERLTQAMAHHVKRPTPSPPLTRFTPVHIIAPEKPYRPWQSRGHSPPQVGACPPASNIKKPVTTRGSTDVADSNSQANWARLEREMEMEREIEREMKREEERKREWERGKERERQWEREMERERKREERALAKGEGRQGEASYRGQQVELSFSARNRKGPASHSTDPTSRETRQGVPTASSYSESLLSTRQIQQQQSLLRAQASQQETRRGEPTRWLQHTVPQHRSTAPRRVATNRPCQSSSSSMGSELDDADDEVKWFTDLAFRSLSSPEVDYLDMYNSSHHSSTNISQPSTQESPAGANAAWMSYADLRGSAPQLESEDFPFHQPSTYYSDGLDPSKRYEMGSFECVDVAVEREETRKVRRGVPKRQIQLKRRNTAEIKQDESSENSSPVVPTMVDSPFLQRRSKETLVRQHSTPAAMQERYHLEPSPEPIGKNERKSKLQKSASLDETCTKTKMATCLIKSVLSKKMQSVDKQTDRPEREEVDTASENKTPPPDSVVTPVKESSKMYPHNLSSSLQSDHSLSFEDLAMRREREEGREPSPRCEVKQQNSPNATNISLTSPQTGIDRTDSQSRRPNSEETEMRSELMMSFDSKKRERDYPRMGGEQADDSNRWEEREGGDSAKAAAGNTGPTAAATGASGMQDRVTNREQECEFLGTEDHTQDSERSMYMSKTPEITFKASPSPIEKKKTSLSVSLTPEENKPEVQREVASPDVPLREREEERSEARVDAKTVEEEGSGYNKVKVPIHKVRDVRRLVKNTYNLSFKATSAVMPSLECEEKAENRMEDKKEEMREETKEERREESIEEKREERQEVKREERWEGLTEERSQERTEEHREERKEEWKLEMKESKLQMFSPSLQRKGQPLSRPQPMQIQCKAISLKENKNKMIPSKTDPETLKEKTQAPPSQLSTGSAKEPDNSSCVNSQSYTTVEAPAAKPYQPDTDMETETLNAEKKTHKVPDHEEKPEVIQRDKKPPMLGSLPKVPSKDREVSTAMVVIKDGYSNAKTSASPSRDETPSPAQAPSTSPGPTSNTTPGPSSHSVSLFMKEKGYHADIGAVVGEGQSEARGKGVPRKHVNRLEIPLQTCAASDRGLTESRRERTFSSSSSQSVSAFSSSNVQPAVRSGPTAVSDNTDNPTKNREEERVSTKPPVKDTTRQNTVSPLRNTQQQTQSQLKQKELGDFEVMKRQDPTFPPKSPALRRFRPQPIEVRSMSKEIQKQETPVNLPKNRPQTIEVKSIANNSQKPVVPPKPNYKFKPADLGSVPNETQKPPEATSGMKPHFEDRSQTIVVSSPTIYRKLSNETSSTSNYTRKLAVSAVSSYKPPPSKTATTISSLSNQSTASSETEGSNDRTQQQQPGASPQSTNYTQRPTTLDAATAPGPIPALAATQAPGPSTVSGPASAVANQSSQPDAADLTSHTQYPMTTYPQEQVMPVTSINAKQPAVVSTTQVPGYTHTRHAYHRLLSNECSQRADDLRFYASDDPPSYDERESFSPLMPPELNPRKPNRYHPSSRLPPCTCTSGCPSHPSLTPPHHHHSPHNLTPPAPSHSPGQALPYPMAQPPLRPHQCRPDPQPMSYQPSSSKSSPLGPSQPPATYQPLHHQPLMQPCPGDRPLQPPQHMDPRRPPVHRSPQQQPPGVGGGPYSDHSHSHSPNLPPMDPQYLCGPQSLGPSYGSEYGGDSSSLYSESSYGQTPRRVLLDPETGKYFYIEMPMQPLRKMLFDPETGQYVEVLIPQQAMSHSGLYPPSAAPYPPLHNPNMYAPPPQYLPYAAPPAPPHPHPQAQPQPPRHPEAPAPGALHQNGSGVSYRSPSGQGSKPELQNHPPLDQSYLESMYYVPTGMNASPNPTPPDCYHKHPPSLPNAGGKRS